MTFDPSKLSPAPWYFVTPENSELETLVCNIDDEDVPVLTDREIGEDACTANWDFLATARNAEDVLMRRKGWVVRQHPEKRLKKRWWVQFKSKGFDTILAREMCGYVHMHDHPFTALVKADEWMKEREGKPS